MIILKFHYSYGFFFHSPAICRYLHNKGFGVVGIVQNNRLGLSSEFKNLNRKIF
jgi:hypothetical protein